jgi:sigma-B regulation protein RsbU (phosphoserine phosphatase)
MPAALQVLKGSNEGAVIPLDGDRFVLGRNPDCGIVIPITSVSREHAQILRVGGKYFIEDKQSRNGTFVNNQAVTVRTLLKNDDKIRICDFLARFLENQASAAQLQAEEPDDADDTSTVEAMLSSQGSHLLLEQAPAEKLRLLLEIGGDLSKTLQLEPLLPKIVDSLFQLFRQADRCFLILAEDVSGKDQMPRLLPKVVKTRRPQDEANARFSKSIVRRCLETSQAFLTDDAQKDDRVQLSQSVVDFRIRSVMCVPLCRADGKAFGVIQLDTQDRSKKFTQDDLKLLWGVSYQASIALENARLHEDAIFRAKLKRDLELAHQVQMSFLPSSAPEVPGYSFWSYYQSAQEVGGDYYGFIPMSGGRMAVTLGDVAGKGVPASLLMAKLSSDTRFALLMENDVGKAVSKLNDLLYPFTSQADKFVTFTAAVIDPVRHTVTLVSAGHPSPLAYRPGCHEFPEVIPKKVAGVPLGIMDGFPFEACQLTMKPGDCLLFFTDGLTDPVDANNQQFGLKGIQTAMQGLQQATPKMLVERIVKAMQAHAAGRPAFDDVTVVAFSRTA